MARNRARTYSPRRRPSAGPGTANNRRRIVATTKTAAGSLTCYVLSEARSERLRDSEVEFHAFVQGELNAVKDSCHRCGDNVLDRAFRGTEPLPIRPNLEFVPGSF
ncbi:hypothetical protein EVAR_94890_1 [Eumeta japonica]|uniref:Uncharacterized protein n=1 Tax=Eumeta variegata TaxID=151549 RepID=A0A4C1V9V5_EUMVA|nr:hypothetical protein EVAR_94890_1 [Eumeta japonica]